jgi:ectoine hydroxylase-related dioxygenase (phytanoyl-CoA dioxygenase family)
MEKDYLSDYREHGFAVVRGVFDGAEVRELAAAFDRVYARGMKHHKSFRHQNVLFRIAQDAQAGRVLRMVQWPSYFDDVLARYRTDPRMLAILEPLLGGDLKQIINQMHWKPPGARNVEFGYHQDIRFRRPRAAYRSPEASYIQTGIAIDAHRPDNGAMTVLPGSHRLGQLAVVAEGQVMNRSISDDDLAALGVDPTSKIDLVLEPGDVALWHLCLIHGSGPNTSQGDRRFYLNGYVTAGNCDRGEWAFRDGRPCVLGEPVLVHYDDLYAQPEPHYLD